MREQGFNSIDSEGKYAVIDQVKKKNKQKHNKMANEPIQIDKMRNRGTKAMIGVVRIWKP